MIRIKYEGQFGNNLFQYIFARLIAEKFGYQLIDNLKYNPILTNTPNKQGLIYNTNYNIINDNYTEFPNSLQQSAYLIDGYFQRKQFYQDKELIKSYLNYTKIQTTNKNDICLHIRLGDYYGLNWVIHPDYYISILEKEEYDNIYLITDSPNDPYLKSLNRFNIKNISSDAASDFYNLMSFDKIIMSNSTFSWWSMFLGNSSKIYTFKRWIESHNYHINELYNLDNSIPMINKYLKE